MLSKKVLLAAAVTAAGFAAGATMADAGPTGSSPVDSSLPEHLRLENLPEMVSVTGPDGEVAGYVDRDLLLAKTRDLPLPEGVAVDGPFPVFDDDGNRIGRWHHDTGFTATGEAGGSKGPTTTAVYSEPPGK